MTDPQPTSSNGFTVHHLRFEVEALTPLQLPAYAGPSIRGALWGALQRHFCPASQYETPGADHKAICPVCWLMATEKPGGARGRDVPRPYIVKPPVRPGAQAWQAWYLEPGERFSFGLTLFAQALNLYPYLVVAMPLMGQTGIGFPLEQNGSRRGQRRRGRFALRRVENVNPLTGEIATLMGEGQTLVHTPQAPVTGRQVAAISQSLVGQLDKEGQLELHFLTPTRIVEGGRLVHQPWLGPLFRRLLERLDALRGEYAQQPSLPNREHLIAQADRVRLVENHTHWLEVKSGSRRLGRATPVSGYIGVATYQVPSHVWAELLPALVWGQEVHVGKNATKGDGWYQIVADGRGYGAWLSSST